MLQKTALIIAAGFLLTACTHAGLSPEPVATPQPEQQAPERPETNTPVFPGDPNGQLDSDDNVSGSDDCGIANCHGLEIECGSEIPQACTLQYELGDFCREYAECGVVNGTCQQIKNDTFTECKSCVEECLQLSEASEQHACEEQCREKINN